MKTILHFITAVLLVAVATHLQAQQAIHSTTIGGLWPTNTTWIEAVPSIGDSVVLQGPVSMLSYTGWCKSLNITTSGSLGGNGNQGNLYVYGSIYNDGNILGSMNYTLYGNLVNNKPWTGVSNYILFYGMDHTFNCAPGASINSQLQANDSLHNFSLLSDLILNTTNASDLGFSQFDAGNHKLTIASGQFNNCRLHSTDTLEINSYVSSLEITGDYKLTGNMTFYYNMVFNGTATNFGTISFTSGVAGDPLKIKGDFLNRGNMNHSWVQVEKNISNEGSWVSERTEFTGIADKHISQTAGHPFGGGQIISDNSGSVIYLDSDVEFTMPQVFLNNNTLNCGTHILTANLTFDKGIIHTEAEIKGNSDFWNSKFTGSVKLSGNNRFSNCTVDGKLENMGMMKDITFYGGIFKSYQNLINHNSIQSMNLKIYGNLTNHGTIDNNSIIDVIGNIAQYINISHSIQSPVTFFSDITGVSYQWMKNGMDIQNAITYDLHFTSLQLADAGVYKCRVVSGTGTTMYSREIVVNNVTSVTENELVTDLLVFPNPFFDYLSLKWEQKTEANVRIDLLDEHGRIVLEIANSVFPSGQNHIERINGAFLKPGIYILRMLNGTKPSTLGIIHLKQ